MAKLTRRQRKKQEQLRADPRRQRILARAETKLATPERRKRRRGAKVEAAELKAKLSGATPIPAVASRNGHPERRPSKPVVLQRDNYAVFVDFHQRTCIRVGAGRDKTYYIPMDSAGIDVQHLTHEKFEANYKPYGYPLMLAARRYAEAAQSFGYTEKARQHLEDILNGSTSPKEQEMATKKQMAKGKAKKHVVFDASRLISKGNPEALKKAREARMAGSTGKYEGRGIKHLVKLDKAGLRKGTARYVMLEYVLKHKKVDEVLGHKVKAGGETHEIRGDNLAGMVRRKHIQLI